MKKIISIMLALALVITSVTFSGTNANVKAEENDWKTTAITTPAEGKLVGAGYIDVIFNTELENAVKYQIYLDGEPYKDFETGKEIIYEAAADTTSKRGEVYTTKVSAHTVVVVATLNDGSTVQTETRTFYVSKKGLAMGGDMSSTVEMKKMNVSWYYNWGTTAFNSSVDDEVAHVPMMWGGAEDNIADLANVTDESNYILGFNEPDIGSQANITPAEGLKVWPYVEALGKRTVSPAAANPNGASSWVTSFLNGDYDEEGVFIEGVDCDAVALHCYGANTKLDRLLTAVDDIWNTYHKPVWVTEVSVMGRKGTSYDNSYENEEARKAVAEYLEKVVEELDSRDYVERYAWFPYDINSKNEIDDMDGSGASAMFDYESGKLTELGFLYASIGNPEGYKTVELTDEDRFIYVEPTTEQSTPTICPTGPSETTQPLITQPSTTQPVAKKPAKVKVKSAKNVKKKSVKLSWKKVANAKKYQIQYSLNKKFKTGKKYKTTTKTTTKVSFTVKKLTKKKKYYFRVRGVNGKVNGSWSKVKSVKIKK